MKTQSINKTSPSSLNQVPMEEDWMAHPAIEWLMTHKKTLLWAFFSLIALLVCASWFINWRTLNAEKDYFQADAAFRQFQKTESTDEADVTHDLRQLDSLMQHHPELKPKYQGSLAQTLMINGQILYAQAFVKDIFTRTSSDHLRLYQDYTETSLVMGQGHYAAALQRAQQLKMTLDQSGAKENPILYVFNLMRLAMLYQQLGEPQQELKTWEELQNQPQLLKAFVVASQAFNGEGALLNQYIEERKLALAP